MRQPTEPSDDIQAEVARRDRLSAFLWLPFMLTALIAWALRPEWSGAVFPLVVVVGVLQLLLDRCPACGAAMPGGRRTWHPATCRSCGARLRPERTPGGRW